MDNQNPFLNNSLNQQCNSQQSSQAPSQYDFQSFQQHPPMAINQQPHRPMAFNPQQHRPMAFNQQLPPMVFNQQHPTMAFNPQYYHAQLSSPQSPHVSNLQSFTNQINNTQPKEKAPNFTMEEDESICKAWLRVSENPITGTYQTRQGLWDGILNEFKQIMRQETIRDSSSLASRWSIIQAQINKYSACVYLAENSQSGHNFEDINVSAKQYFYNQKKKHFKLDSCWLILKDTPKWFHYTKEQEEKKKKSKQKKRANLNSNVTESDDPLNPFSPSTQSGSAVGSINLTDDDSPFNGGSHEQERPIGRKAAKSNRSNKKNYSINLYAEHFSNMRNDQKEIAEKELIMAREREERMIQLKQDQEKLRLEAKFEHQRMKIAAKQEQEKMKMEKEIMMMDPNSAPTEEGKSWIIAQQKIILERMRTVQGSVRDDSSGNKN